MGEVYRARDTKLDRDVAIKVLPELFAADPERIARFEREAKMLASLSHANIGSIHGLEHADGFLALVLELVEGPTLADRIAQGLIPLDEALPIARQIAEALEAAHEQGIIHRDLKPANIKVRPDGTVKVLDFGLAKAMEPIGSAPMNVSQSPTITSPAMMTGVGMILGTAAYMSPEQAKGRPVDKRADIWAFGCVLYEMLAGKRAFQGDDVSDTLATVLKSEPAWSALPLEVPPAIRMLIRRCLEKDRNRRVTDISTAVFLINAPSTLAPVPSGTNAPYVAARRSRERLGWLVAGVLLLVGALSVPFAVVHFESLPRTITRFASSYSHRIEAPCQGLLQVSLPTAGGWHSSLRWTARPNCGFVPSSRRRPNHWSERTRRTFRSGRRTAISSAFLRTENSGRSTRRAGHLRRCAMHRPDEGGRGVGTE